VTFYSPLSRHHTTLNHFIYWKGYSPVWKRIELWTVRVEAGAQIPCKQGVWMTDTEFFTVLFSNDVIQQSPKMKYMILPNIPSPPTPTTDQRREQFYARLQIYITLCGNSTN
jgi:hypothetical protein